MKREETDVLVIGAGPSGTVAASIVHQAGLRVKIVEKQHFPRFQIGESLLPKCMEALDAAGFIEAIEAKGFQQKFGAKFVRDGQVCDFNFEEKFTPGWSWTWQAPRADLDLTLTDAVQKMGVPVEFGTTVTGIAFNGTDSVTTVLHEDGTTREIAARFIVDASGYGRVIPSLFNLDRPSDQPPRKTLFAHIKDVKRDRFGEGNRITIISHKPGVWIWVIPFSNGNASLGFVGDPSYFTGFNGSPQDQLRAMISTQPHISERFENCEFIFEPRVLQAWSVTTDKFYGDGFVLTGNVTEFLDPIFSSGVTLAVVSGHLGAKLACKQLKGEKVNWEEEYTKPTMQGVNTFRSYVTAWYDDSLPRIFFDPNPSADIKSYICSVLAGYVWDLNNPYVKRHGTAIRTLASFLEMQEKGLSADPQTS
jgi:flavin-dependent dehydrogenase